jgi:LysR family hydrogen peroxide-inducible transcriptional activator
MNFRDLEYLVAVVRLTHFGKAAEECHVSQSALSLQLQKLEQEIGVQLLERTSRSVVVTEAGMEAARRAQQLLQGRRDLIDSVRPWSGGLPMKVRVGAIPTIAPFQFTRLQTEFHARHPDTTLQFDEDVTELLVPAVASGQVDAGLIATPPGDSLLDEVDLFEEPFLLAAPSGHPLAGGRSISPDEIAPHRLLQLKNTHCLQEQVMDFCSNHRVSPTHLPTASSIATLLALVQAGVGLTLIPRMAVGSAELLSGICCLPISPAPTRKVRVIFRKTSTVGRRLAEAIRTSLD